MGDFMTRADVSESDYENIIHRQSSSAATNNELFELMDRALAEHPTSIRLWCQRGDLMRNRPPESPHVPPEALSSYERAIDIDPECAQAFEGIGHYYSIIKGDPTGAAKYLQRAIELGAGASAYVGLHEVLALVGREAEARQLLYRAPDFIRTDPTVAQLIRQLENALWSST